jgi:hypothetical protein
MTIRPLARRVQIHKALAHPARLRLLAAVGEEPDHERRDDGFVVSSSWMRSARNILRNDW